MELADRRTLGLPRASIDGTGWSPTATAGSAAAAAAPPTLGTVAAEPQVIGAASREQEADGIEMAGGFAAHAAETNGGQGEEAPFKKCGKWRKNTALIRTAVKVMGLGLMGLVFIVAVVDWPPWVIEEENARARVLSVLFAVGLFIVAVEEFVDVNKSAVMLVMAASMWTLLAVGYHPRKSRAGANELHEELARGIEDVGSVVLFLLPAMAVVESMDHLRAFSIITCFIRRVMDGHPRRLIPIISILTFFLSSAIDNLTSTIVALKILRRVASDDHDRRRACGGLAVIAANAGGAWSPVGDVTTTMLWIQGKVTAPSTISWLFLPSFVAGVLPMGCVWWQVVRSEEPASPVPSQTGLRRPRHGNGASSSKSGSQGSSRSSPEVEDAPLRLYGIQAESTTEAATTKSIVALVLGLVCMLMVPVLKISTGLPPYLGMLGALGVMWLVTDSFDFGAGGLEAPPPDRQHGQTVGLGNGAALPASEATSGAGCPSDGGLAAGVAGTARSLREEEEAEEEEEEEGHRGGVMEALRNVDLQGLLFFVGVLLAVGALNSAGVLRRYADKLVAICGHSAVLLCTVLGISSAVVDNVPLVEAAIDMFSETGPDEPLWQLVALAAGTGGSLLSVGSIAGVTLMSMESVSFLWYCRRLAPWAAVGFAASILVYQLERQLFG